MKLYSSRAVVSHVSRFRKSGISQEDHTIHVLTERGLLLWDKY